MTSLRPSLPDAVWFISDNKTMGRLFFSRIPDNLLLVLACDAGRKAGTGVTGQTSKYV